MFEEEYDDFDSIPAAVRHLYKEVGGKWVLLKAGEVKSVEDVNRLHESLRKERNDHKATKDKLAKFGDRDADEILAQLDRIDELEAAAGGKLDETKINEMVETRLRSRVAPIERERDTLKTQLNEANGTIETYRTKERTALVHTSLGKAAKGAKLIDSALDDVLMYDRLFEVDEAGNVVTKDGVGVTPGLSPDVWITEMLPNRPHWAGETRGVGARGGDGGSHTGANPFSKDGWNLTEQGRLVKLDRNKAEQLARAAGTTIGGPRPTK